LLIGFFFTSFLRWLINFGSGFYIKITSAIHFNLQLFQ